jgi:hypothetical protein
MSTNHPSILLEGPTTVREKEEGEEILLEGPTTVREKEEGEEEELLELGETGVTIGQSPGRKYRVVKAPVALELCGRSIGGGETICVKKSRANGEDSCGTSHQGKANVLTSGALYVSKTPTSVFTHPMVEICLISPKLYLSWLNSSGRELNEWLEDFSTINRQLKAAAKAQGGEDEDSFEGFTAHQILKESLEQAKKSRRDYIDERTPKKPKISRWLSVGGLLVLFGSELWVRVRALSKAREPVERAPSIWNSFVE